MSEYITMNLNIESKEDIIAALEKIGVPHEVHDTAVNLHGYTGDTRKQTAEIVVRRQHVGGAANDLGFKWNEKDGRWDMIVSDYDRGGNLVGTFKQMINLVMLERLAEDSMRTCEIIEGNLPTALKQRQTIKLRIK